ncbi:TolC family protein [Flavihumibacter sp. ZG627]|uniref:TolC family protein n=1 Tax=Flavihumibacter sp. ZG627 TaxID=1463156 RepID=UPI00057F7AF8|nr:TolC family protein [Flavihumibacter sp. ZG627]KIC90498.1 hypothetical protein HY58_11125 [Flavihumibacter sp. ZG627]
MRNLVTAIIMSLVLQPALAQYEVDSIVRQVERNNKEIAANQELTAAKAALFKTGLTPTDPFVEYDYMFGSPAGAGNQRDFAITQRIDFPSVYRRKKQLSEIQIAQTDLQRQVFRQDILLEAKLLALRVIYLNRRQTELKRRLASTKKLASDLRKKLEQGDIIILDMNKVKLQLLTIQNEVALTENEKTVVLARLLEMNGNIPVRINDTIYPQVPIVPAFDKLDSIIEVSDPLIKVYEQEKKIQDQQINVQKGLNLPKLETGYHSQGILGQSYRGVHFGVAIPLWENKNRLNAAKAALNYATSAADAHRLEHRQTNRQYYEQLAVREKAMLEHKELLETLNNEYLLGKALSLGQITIVQYFYEQSFYYSAYDKYLQMEAEYHKALAQLFRYTL